MDASNAVNPSENNATARSQAQQARLSSLLNDASIVAAPSYDEPYKFGRRPNSRSPFPLTEREFARLLIVRGRIHARHSALNRSEA